VAPVLKSRFENLELELSIRRSQSTNKALFRFAGILKASPLKDTTSDHYNTQEHQSRGQQMLSEMQRRFGVSCQCRGGLVDWIGAWWSGPTVMCNTSDHPKWGQVPTPLNEFCFYSSCSCCQTLSRYDAGILSFHISRQWASYSHYMNIHIHFATLIFRPFFIIPTLVFTRFSLVFHSSSLKTTTTRFYNVWRLFGLWGCEVSSCAVLEGVC
jgi:hypothetical protein